MTGAGGYASRVGKEASLCSPGRGLGCIACCPPIRPPGYDHHDHRLFLRREFAANRAAYLAGDLPTRPIIGFTCPGLGFLDVAGRRAGCLFHPARNQERDLRFRTGYAEKCAREMCPAAQAYAGLEHGAREALLDLCAGMDSFVFSSPAQNPVMRLLEFGPDAAALAAGLPNLSLDEMGGWTWLHECPPAWGWLLGRAGDGLPPSALGRPELAERLGQAAERLVRELEPRPPLEWGERLERHCDMWEARFWRLIGGRSRATLHEVAGWRQRLSIAVDDLNAGLLS